MRTNNPRQFFAEICVPGEYSENGLSPCTASPPGRYTEGYRQTSSKACPTGTTTVTSGATSPYTCGSKCFLFFEMVKAVSKTVLDMINATYYAKLLVFIKATFQEKLVSRHRAVNEGCFWNYIRYDKCHLLCQAVGIHRGYVSGEARLSSSGSEWRLFLKSY